MVNITQKPFSLRKAIAQAIVTVSMPGTIRAIERKEVPKGDVFAFSRAAGLLAVKKTSDVIPDCHPLPVEYAAIGHRIDGLDIIISVEVHTIYRTGVEVEAMHGAAITALTLYDMLKPIDPTIVISEIRLLDKKGGKSSFSGTSTSPLRCAVMVCSDTVSAGVAEDASGDTVIRLLEAEGLSDIQYAVLPDDLEQIRAAALQFSAENYDLLIVTGGTGLSPRDVTPQAIGPLLDPSIPGIMEAARRYGQERTPYAMLSRGVAGFIGTTLTLTLPGSVKGVEESMEALFPYVLHIFQVAKSQRHDQK
jgi:cyclic pyranopterin monophosphate synthase